MALYKELLAPGHPQLVKAQESLRTAKLAGLQQKSPTQQVQSLTDQLATHRSKVEHLLDEAAHIEEVILERTARHKSLTAEVEELSQEMDTLGVQLEVARRAEARAKPPAAEVASVSRHAGTVGSVVDQLGADFGAQLAHMAQRLQGCSGQMSQDARNVLDETFAELQRWSSRITSDETKQRIASASPAPQTVVKATPPEAAEGSDEPFVEGAGGPPFPGMDESLDEDLEDQQYFNEEYNEFDDDTYPPPGGGRDINDEILPDAPGASGSTLLTGPPDGTPDSLAEEPPVQEASKSSKRLLAALQDFAASSEALSNSAQKYAKQESGARGGGATSAVHPPGGSRQPA